MPFFYSPQMAFNRNISGNKEQTVFKRCFALSEASTPTETHLGGFRKAVRAIQNRVMRDKQCSVKAVSIGAKEPPRFITCKFCKGNMLFTCKLIFFQPNTPKIYYQPPASPYLMRVFLAPIKSSKKSQERAIVLG